MSGDPTGGRLALLTDLYELTMLQAYFDRGMRETAVFDLFFRQLPGERNFLLACGLDSVLAHLETLRFSEEDVAYLRSLDGFSEPFLESLLSLRFTGDVHAVPEGTPVFPNEPLLQVEAPLPEAQVVETFVLNQIHFQTLAASKASRVVRAAAGRPVVDFGLRRMHGSDAGVAGARAFHVAGIAATSNVLAGKRFGVPVAGTMAHSFVEAFDHERDAFRAFAKSFPGSILLVDTYDTLEGTRLVIDLVRREGLSVRGIRIDSGDLGALSRDARRLLDEAGLRDVEIFGSGGLDEMEIRDLVAAGAPIDGFGVGTRMGVSADAPHVDMAYKLSGYGGKGRMKLSPGKANVPGPKQLHRIEHGGRAVRDVVATRAESHEGRPLLVPVMHGGQRTPAGKEGLDAARERAQEELARLPEPLLALERAPSPYPVERSPALEERTEAVRQRIRDAVSGASAD